jgi:HKD family nuclease
VKIIEKLSDELSIYLSQADEVWIAVALIKRNGFSFIQSKINTNAKQNFIVGIDLPTDVFVLNELFNNEQKYRYRIFSNSNQTFHPKLYIVRIDTNYIAFVGSGNCTNGGLMNNVELSYKVTDEKECISLVAWFEDRFKEGKKLSGDFIKEYTAFNQERISFENKIGSLSQFLIKDSEVVTDYDFSNQFFKKEHYDTFLGDKTLRNDKQVNIERKEVGDRLLELHKLLYPRIQLRGWDVHPHYSDNHIISSTERLPRSSTELGAIWLHYGKHPDEIKRYMKLGENQTPLYHIRLQVIILKDKLGIWLIAKKNGGHFDRGFFKDSMRNNGLFRDRFYSLFKQLSDEYYIEINEDWRYVPEVNNSQELFDFTKDDNIEEFYFMIGRDYLPNAPEISNENIVNTIIDEYEKLYPIYEHIRHRM